MELSVNRLYGGVVFGDEKKYVIRQMTFDIFIRGITDIEEINEAIRQLQQVKCEVANGCTKAVIHPATSLDQTEGDNRNLGK